MVSSNGVTASPAVSAVTADNGLGQVLLWTFVLVLCCAIVLGAAWAGGARAARYSATDGLSRYTAATASRYTATEEGRLLDDPDKAALGEADVDPVTIPGYCVVFVDKGVDSGEVMRTLQEAGCTEVISADGAEVLSLPDMSTLLPDNGLPRGYAPRNDYCHQGSGASGEAISSFVQGNSASSGKTRQWAASSYISLRRGYFTDESGKYALYYVPEKFALAVNKCLAAMTGVDAGVMGQRVTSIHRRDRGNAAALGDPDIRNRGSASVLGNPDRGQPAVRFIVVIIAAAVILCMMSGDVVRSILSFALPVLLAMSGKGGGGDGVWVEISAAAAMCAAAAARTLWTRPHSVWVVVRCGVAPAFAAVSLVTGIIGGAGLLSAVVLAGSFAALRVHHLVKKAAARRHLFCPVPILGAKAKWTAVESVSLGMGALMCVLFPIMGMGMTSEAAASTSTPSTGSGTLTPTLTGEVQEAQAARPDVRLPGALPTVDDYCRWCWQCVTYPYTRLGTGESGTVSFPTYKEENGVIKQDIIEMKMDDDFRARCIAAIDQLPAGAVEHLMAGGPRAADHREAVSRGATHQPRQAI